MPSVMIIDDQATGRMILEQVVRSIDEDLDVILFADPIKALEQAKLSPPDLVLTDVKMPDLDGVTFTHWFRQIPACRSVPLIIITGVEDNGLRYRSLEAGATDFLTKPIDHHECRCRCRNLLTLSQQQALIRDRARWLEKEITQITQALAEREHDTLLRLARAGEYRDPGTGEHVQRIGVLARMLAETMGQPAEFCDLIQHAAPLHDIGKIGIPDAILLKPGRHTEQESRQMREHTRIGYEILKDSPSSYLRMGATIALHHHERHGGGGYPQGLVADEIPLEAAIVSVVDVCDALKSERVYKSERSWQEVFDYLGHERGNQFHPEVVDAFFKCKDRIVHEYGNDQDLAPRQDAG